MLFEQVSSFLEQGKYVTIPVKGSSMMPFLKEGDSVTLKPVVSKELTKGLIVLAELGGKVILHRVVRFERGNICLAGDGNLVTHELVSSADIMAVLVYSSRSKRITYLNQYWWRSLGLFWYWARPLRRIIRKSSKIFHA